jgi:transcriptional regulator with XRE-family HTH domain
MNKTKSFRIEKQAAAGTSMALRLTNGAAAAIARRLGVNRSTVSRVARGLKTSERVSIGIFRYLLKNNGAR